MTLAHRTLPDTRLLDADQRLGTDIRARRIAAGMSQEALGTAIGASFQQVQKYERGTNPIPGTRLAEIAKALGTDIDAICRTAGLGASRPNARAHEPEADLDQPRVDASGRPGSLPRA